MIAEGSGSIINMSSVTAQLGRTRQDPLRHLNAIVIGCDRDPSEAVDGDPEELNRYFCDLQALKRRVVGMTLRRRSLS